MRKNNSKKLFGLLLVFLGILLAFPFLADAEEKAPKEMQTIWKDGVKFQYKKGGIEMAFGGRLLVDWLFWNANQNAKNAYGPAADGVEIRRARLFTSGTFYNRIVYRLQLEFSSGDVEFRSAFLGAKDIPYIGSLLIGNIKEPFSLADQTSSKYTTFVERPTLVAFAPDYNVGILIRNNIKKRFHYDLGVFKETDDQGFGLGDSNWAFTGRVTGLPVYADGGRVLVHLGAAYSFRNPPMNIVRYKSRPEHHLAPNFLDTRDPITGADLQTDRYQIVGGEAAFVFGPFSMQAEYVASLISGAPLSSAARFPYSGGGDAFFQGAYIYASYFLTGEHRAYKNSLGVFTNVKPKRVFLDGKGGTGAIEVGARYSYLDLQDGLYNPNLSGTMGAAFGTMNNYTAVLNWYLNPNTRVSTNFTFSDPDPYGLAYLWTTRFQVAF